MPGGGVRAYRIAYDGRSFHGFQRQPDVPTVEGALLSALSALDVGGESGKAPPGYAAAGRTDAGASALAQTVAFRAPEWLDPRALNGELLADVRAWASAEAPADFHATREAAWREYAYHWHAPGAHLGEVRGILSRLEGTHDFHNLTAVTDDAVDTTRTVLEADADREGEFLVVRVRADGFLREMVRRIVTLLAVTTSDGRTGGDPTAGAGAPPAIDPPVVERVLSAEELTGPEGIGPAPADPLVLSGVGYPGLEFAVDPGAAASLREVFGTRRVEAATRARAMGAIRDGVDRRG